MTTVVKFVLLLNIFSSQTARCDCLFDVNCEVNDVAEVNAGQDGQRGNVLMTIKLDSHFQCSAMCRAYEQCSHYSWDMENRMCDLVNVPGGQSLTTCQGKAGPCGERPCESGEICLHTRAANSYICLPADGISGTTTTTPTTATTTTTPTMASAKATTTVSSTSSTTSTTTTPATTTTPSATTTTSTTTTTTTPSRTIGLMTLGMSCSAAADCILTNAECDKGGCRCVLGYHFSNTKQTCTKSCVELGSDFVLYSNTGIMGYNDETSGVPSIDACKQKCLNISSMTCKTFEIVVSSPYTCRLSTVFWYDVASSQRLSISSVDLYSRQCQ